MQATALDNMLIEIEAPIAMIVLNRPDAANGVTPSMAGELFKAFDLIAARDDVRAVRCALNTSAGPEYK